jgi:inner membrane protein
MQGRRIAAREIYTGVTGVKNKKMTGKTHKFIGIAAGAAAAYYGMTVIDNDAALFYLMACPIGAMIPDIDHDNSKLGRSRKNITTAISTLFSSFALVAVIFFLVDAYQNERLFSAISTVLLILIPFVLLASLSKIKVVKKNLKFMVKHRGLMHTLILPACMFGAGFLVTEPTFKILLTGLNIGYITHILSDLLTTRGCPILYPVTKKNIKFMNIKTGSPAEYIAGVVLSVIIAALFLTGLITPQ